MGTANKPPPHSPAHESGERIAVAKVAIRAAEEKRLGKRNPADLGAAHQRRPAVLILHIQADAPLHELDE